MADLIDREVARTTICEKCENYSTVLQECKLSDGGGWCKVFSLYDVPTVDAKPVRRGRWNYRHEDDWCYCTACGKDADVEFERDYCPNCGARMDGGADNGTD